MATLIVDLTVRAVVVVLVTCATLSGCSERTGSADDDAVKDEPRASGAAGKSARGDVKPTGKVPIGTKNDCEVAKWTNDGDVTIPEVEAVPADAGTTGHMFGRSKNLPDAYVEQEFLFTGTTPAYTTRMVVHRPKDSTEYNGSVLVEWYNVSGQLDFAPEWAWNRDYFMREGWAHIAVSAQAVGANALKTFDSSRYEKVNHPGDTAAPAIFSQAGAAIRSKSELILGKCMPVHALIAAGQSQSSFQLASYTNGAQVTDKVYDGIVLHSGLEPASNNPNVPVFELFTMSEGNNALMDGPTLVKWVVAGATHSDATLSSVGLEAGEDLAGFGAAPECVNPPNTFPAYRVYSAAFDWMNRWVRDGMRPPAGTPLGAAKDSYGNMLGGVRLPEIDVPTATYGTSNAAAPGVDFISAMACSLGGATAPFSPSLLEKLYPSHADYVKKYTAAANKALSNGYLLKDDFEIAIEEAKSASVPK